MRIEEKELLSAVPTFNYFSNFLTKEIVGILNNHFPWLTYYNIIAVSKFLSNEHSSTLKPLKGICHWNIRVQVIHCLMTPMDAAMCVGAKEAPCREWETVPQHICAARVAGTKRESPLSLCIIKKLLADELRPSGWRQKSFSRWSRYLTQNLSAAADCKLKVFCGLKADNWYILVLIIQNKKSYLEQQLLTTFILWLT